jgi:hypothetical protein
MHLTMSLLIFHSNPSLSTLDVPATDLSQLHIPSTLMSSSASLFDAFRGPSETCSAGQTFNHCWAHNLFDEIGFGHD